MGLMTKPAGGVLDAIAMALDGIKRCDTLSSPLVKFLNPLHNRT